MRPAFIADESEIEGLSSREHPLFNFWHTDELRWRSRGLGFNRLLMELQTGVACARTGSHDR